MYSREAFVCNVIIGYGKRGGLGFHLLSPSRLPLPIHDDSIPTHLCLRMMMVVIKGSFGRPLKMVTCSLPPPLLVAKAPCHGVVVYGPLPKG